MEKTIFNNYFSRKEKVMLENSTGIFDENADQIEFTKILQRHNENKIEN